MNTQQDQNLSESEEKDKEYISVVTCDMEGRIETFGEGASEIFGYSPEEVIGKKRVSAFSPGKVVLGHVNTWLKTACEKGEFETDTTFIHKDGHSIPAHIRITPTFSIIDGVKTQIGYCGKTKILEGVDPKTTMPKDPWWIKMLSALVITS